MLNLCESSILETWRGRIFMLAQTVRSNLKDINNLRMRTKTTKFSSLFQTAPTVGVEEDDVIVENKGDLIILIMVENENNREKIDNNFKSLK